MARASKSVTCNSYVSTDINCFIAETANYMTMRNLIVVTEGLSIINNTIFLDVLSKFDKGIKGSWGWLIDGIQTNAKSGNCVFALIVNYDKIKNGLAFIKDGWSTEALTLKETLAFFDDWDRYNNLELESALLTLNFFEQDKSLIV